MNTIKSRAKVGLRKLTPHQRICHAAKNLTGLRLTSSEAFALSRDHAIWYRAQLDDEADAEAREEQSK